MTLLPRSSYVHALRPNLPADVFRPATQRLALAPLLVAIIALATLGIASARGGWSVAIGLSLVIGISFACLAFLAHELLHGAVVRSRPLSHVLGWICFLPLLVSPELWIAWHVRAHHGHANQVDADPDMYPTLAAYRASGLVRLATDSFALGGRRWRGLSSLVFGFSVRNAQMLVSWCARDVLSRRQRAMAACEVALALAVWTAHAAVLGLGTFAFAFVVPTVIANAIVMAFVLTNHGLSPVTGARINDPLVTGLSVTAPRWIERLTLNFGYHVEHHLFPSVSSRHAPAIRALLRAHWPERYQSMPLAHALRALRRTGRVYKDATTLIDPRTGSEFPTLVPRVRDPSLPPVHPAAASSSTTAVAAPQTA